MARRSAEQGWREGKAASTHHGLGLDGIQSDLTLLKPLNAKQVAQSSDSLLIVAENSIGSDVRGGEVGHQSVVHGGVGQGQSLNGRGGLGHDQIFRVHRGSV